MKGVYTVGWSWSTREEERDTGGGKDRSGEERRREERRARQIPTVADKDERHW